MRLQLGLLASRRAGPLRARRSARRGRDLGRRPAPASPTRRSSSPRSSSPAAPPTRPSTWATPPRRTSRAAAPPGSLALLIDRDGGADIDSLDAIRHHLTSDQSRPSTKKPAIEPASQSTAGSAPATGRGRSARRLPRARLSQPGAGPDPRPAKPGRSWGPGRVAVGILAPAPDDRVRGRGRLGVRPRPELAGRATRDPGAPRGDPGGGRLRGHGRAERGHRRPRAPSVFAGRSGRRSGSRAAAYLGYIVSRSSSPSCSTRTRRTSRGTSASATAVRDGRGRRADHRRRPALRGDLLPRLHLRRAPQPALVPDRRADLRRDLRPLPLHGRRSIAVVPQLAFLGFVLCWVYEETGSIYPTIAIHVVTTLIAFIVLTS